MEALGSCRSLWIFVSEPADARLRPSQATKRRSSSRNNNPPGVTLKLKDYIKSLSKYPTDSEEPGIIVQQLAVLAAVRAADKGRLPASCGKGKSLDMDIVQAGILAGLERVHQYDGTLGHDMRAFLYKTIAGTIQDYAWKRENRITDGRWKFPELVLDSVPYFLGEGGSGFMDAEAEGDHGKKKTAEDVLLEEVTPLAIIEAEEEEDGAKTAVRRLRKVLGSVGEEGKAMLIRDSQIGRNRLLREQWAREIGITPAALHMRLVRLRQKAREWALTLQ